MYELIGCIQKNSIERIKVELSEFHGYQNVSMRVFKSDPLTDGEIPVKKGLTCSVRILPQLITTLQAAERKARELGVLEDEAIDGEDQDTPISSTRELYQRARAKELSKGDA